MKTQETVLKQRISWGLILGFIFLTNPGAHGFSGQAPWINQVGLEHGFSLGGTAQLESGESKEIDFNLNANAATSDETSLFGQASSRYDQRLGAVKSFTLNSTHSLSAQTEGSFDISHVWGFDVGAFDRIDLRQFDVPHFAVEFGAGVQYQPATARTSIPFSFGLMKADALTGFHYGIYLRGERLVSEQADQDLFDLSVQAKIQYITEDHMRFEVIASAPTTQESTRSVFSIRAGLTFTFGQNPEPTFLPTRTDTIPENTDQLHYNLKAKVVSMNDALFLIKIDKGSSDSIVKGQTFDIYSGETLMARAQAVSVKLDEAALNVIEYKQEQWIELGFIARRLNE